MYLYCAPSHPVCVCVCLCAFQLHRSSVLFEAIRRETQHSTDCKLSLFDLQTSSYQALQRVLVSLGDLVCPHLSHMCVNPVCVVRC